MTRRFNYTGRKRLDSSRFSTRLVSKDPLRASVTLDLAELELAPDAEIIVEPYSGTVSRRIHCGTVAQPAVPNPIVLDDLEGSTSIQFRARVVEPSGRLLASAERVKLHGLEDEDGRMSLLPVELTPDLEEEIWEIEVSETLYPKLKLNSRIPAIEQKLLTDPVFGGAVIVAALRRVFEYLLEDPDGDVWQADWLKFARTLDSGFDPEKAIDDEDRAAAAGELARKFARQQNFVTNVLAGMSN